MARQGYPATGTRFGGHPGVAGYPTAGARFGAHPTGSSGTPDGPLNAVAQSSTTDFVGTFTSNLPLQPLTIAPNPTLFLVGDVGLSGGGASTMNWVDQSA